MYTEFVQDAQQKYGNRYIYSSDGYIDNKTVVNIICLNHGEFSVTPEAHINGEECEECSTIKDWIKRASKVHDNVYNYSKLDYGKSNSILELNCESHGPFKVRAVSHIRGKGCNKCPDKKLRKWIKKIKLQHNNSYDYSKVECKIGNKPITVTCKIHGDFSIKPLQHVKGTGCKECSKRGGMTQTEWIEKAKQVHNNVYDYSKVKYESVRSRVIITCKKHGDIDIIALSHLNGSKCIKCIGRYIMTQDEWIEKANQVHNNKYDYSKTKYERTRTNITITCREHGDFEIMSRFHTDGMGCRKCTKNFCMTQNEWIEKANQVHNNIYDYSKTKYKRTNDIVIITCKEHGDFEVIARFHLKGSCCKKCRYTN